jgi:hypothetical protein
MMTLFVASLEAIMRFASLVVALILAVAGSPARAADASEGLALSRMLALMQEVMEIAASAPPAGEQRAMDKAVRDILTGRNPQANALARDIASQLSPDDRERLAAIGRSAATLSERSAATAPAALAAPSVSDRQAIDARKDLAAMGLVYHDPRQFIDAVRRGDAIAVHLFVTGRGVPLDARDADGASALDIARRSGNAELISLLAGAGS